MCLEVIKRPGGTTAAPFLYTAKFLPVTSGSPENEKFFQWTPVGSFEIGAYVKEDTFIPGVAYYLDITPATN